ncbi:unnamed protein product, partial [Ascophyllum nodosum]
PVGREGEPRPKSHTREAKDNENIHVGVLGDPYICSNYVGRLICCTVCGGWGMKKGRKMGTIAAKGRKSFIFVGYGNYRRHLAALASQARNITKNTAGCVS